MLKRIALIALAGLMLLGSALGETISALPTYETYAQSYSAPEGTEWEEEGDIRVLELENDIAIHLCLVGDDIVALTIVAPVETDYTETALEALRALNVLSDASLEQIAGLQEETELEGYRVTPMKGKSYAGIAICLAESETEWVWQPLRGGEKYHAKSICGRTEAPRLETKEAAEALEFTPCSRCFADDAEETEAEE